MMDTAEGIVKQIKPHKTGKSVGILLDDGEWYNYRGKCPYALGERVVFEYEVKDIFKNIVSRSAEDSLSSQHNVSKKLPPSADTSYSIRLGQAQKQATAILASLPGAVQLMIQGDMTQYEKLTRNILRANEVMRQ